MNRKANPQNIIEGKQEQTATLHKIQRAIIEKLITCPGWTHGLVDENKNFLIPRDVL